MARKKLMAWQLYIFLFLMKNSCYLSKFLYLSYIFTCKKTLKNKRIKFRHENKMKEKEFLIMSLEKI